MDQLFVQLKQSVVALAPGSVRFLVTAMLSIGPIMGFYALLFGVVTILERKGLARIQNRPGPNRVGPAGFLQFVADGIKMLMKEDIVPRRADRWVHFLAPLTLVVPAWMAFAVLPMGRGMQALRLEETALIYFFAVGAATELSVFMAGWSSANKYSLLGAMRAVAQMISYEAPLVLSTLAVVMAAGSLSLNTIVEGQGRVVWGLFHAWNVWTPWGLAGFLLFLSAACAEANRTPFDLPEAESEIIAGYFTEYSGFKFALFFLGEYLGLFSMCGLGVTLYLGGWQSPSPYLDWVPSWLWFFGKVLFLVAIFVWLRGTLPRLRQDQLLRFAWTFLLPMTVLNAVVAAIWLKATTWNVAVRWVICAGILAGAYAWVNATRRREYPARVYRFET